MNEQKEPVLDIKQRLDKDKLWADWHGSLDRISDGEAGGQMQNWSDFIDQIIDFSIGEILKDVKRFVVNNERLENNPEGYDGIIDTYVIDVEDLKQYLESLTSRLK